MDQRARRSPARFLGPLALIAVVVVFLAIISGSGNNGGSSSSTTSSTTASQTSTASKKSSKSKAHTKTTTDTTAKVYIVKVGDTLGAIAAKTGVPLATIQSLNPNVDPHAMVAGQRIRLK